MAAHVESSYRRLGASSLYVSEEIPEILGTGGALSALANWWGDSQLLVYNGDVISNLQLDALVAMHRDSNAVVTMAVTRNPPSGGGRSVWVNRQDKVVAIAAKEDLPSELDLGELRECGFACAYVADPRLRAYLPQKPKFFDIIIAFQKAIADGLQISALFHNGFWADVGTPLSLWQTNLQVAGLSRTEQKSILGDRPIERVATQETQFDIDSHSVIGALAHVGEGARISSSVILDGGVVQNQEKVSRNLRGPGFTQTFPSAAD